MGLIYEKIHSIDLFLLDCSFWRLLEEFILERKVTAEEKASLWAAYKNPLLPLRNMDCFLGLLLKEMQLVKQGKIDLYDDLNDGDVCLVRMFQPKKILSQDRHDAIYLCSRDFAYQLAQKNIFQFNINVKKVIRMYHSSDVYCQEDRPLRFDFKKALNCGLLDSYEEERI